MSCLSAGSSFDEHFCPGARKVEGNGLVPHSLSLVCRRTSGQHCGGRLRAGSWAAVAVQSQVRLAGSASCLGALREGGPLPSASGISELLVF